MGCRWSLSFPFQFLIILVDSSFVFAGMTRIAKRRIYFLTLCFLFLLTHAWGTLVQVDQVSSPAGHVNDSRVVESVFPTMQPTLIRATFSLLTVEMNGCRCCGRSVTEATVSQRGHHPHGSLFSFHRRHGRRRGDGLV